MYKNIKSQFKIGKIILSVILFSTVCSGAEGKFISEVQHPNMLKSIEKQRILHNEKIHAFKS